jgi:hypothetical protein
MARYPKIFLVIFLCTFASLAYEIILTRIFSVALWYHFAFMIISIAMLGIGASGTLISLYPKLRDISHIGLYSLLLGISISLSYLGANEIPFDPVKLSWSKMQLLYIGLYYMVLSIPFFFTGLIVATALASFSERAGLFYGADLLGAGIGSLGVIFFMTISMPETIVFVLSLFALTGSLIAGEKRLKAISLVCILCVLAVVVLRPEFMKLRMSQYKGLEVALRYPGAEHVKTYGSPFSRIDVIKSPAVRFAPGLSLRYLDKLPEQIGFSIDGGELHAITEGNDKASPTFLSYLPSALPYAINKSSLSEEIEGLSDVLIIDPKGCLQCLVARHYGFSNIHKIESNPLLVKIMQKDFSGFSGGVYDQDTWSGQGRAWLRNHGLFFDIIDIPLTGATPSGTFGILEDYKLTVEAFREYFGYLTPNGIISVNLFIIPPPRTELRILATALAAMKESGIPDQKMKQHVTAFRSWGTISILIKKSPFTSHEIDTIKRFAQDRRFDLIYYPGIREEETNIHIRMPTSEYFTTFQKILSQETRQGFINDYPFDVTPVRDENPFFHYYLKLSTIKEIYSLMGEKWQYFVEEGYILPVVFLQVIGFSLILILLPAYSPGTEEGVHDKGGTSRNERAGKMLLPYFAFLGLGFMFVEVSLIQRMIFPLENSSYAFATVLTSLLISSGIGSLFSYRIKVLRSASVTVVLSLLIITYSLFISPVSDVVSSYPVSLKVLLVFLVLMPLGIFMGVPFPVGLKILGETGESLIPWAWAINGCFSVLAPIVTIMLAMIVGFKIVLWLGALLYLMAFLTLLMYQRNQYSEKNSALRSM